MNDHLEQNSAYGRVRVTHLRDAGASVSSVRSFTLSTGIGETSVVIGDGALNHLPELCAGSRVLLAIDDRVARLYGAEMLDRLAAARVGSVRLAAGERAKTLRSAERLWGALASHRLGRADVLVAVGGGATLDVAGFVASTWMRGMRWIAVPTTLVAQADACIGGKCAINLAAGKNLVGSFHLAEAALIEPRLLASLPARDHQAGRFELLKCGWLGDPDLRRLALSARCANREPVAVTEAVERALRVKAQLVAADLYDRGDRRLLNLGHTFGHALEVATDFRGVAHGEAVGIGLLAAAILAHRLGLIDARDLGVRRREVIGLAPPVLPARLLPAAIAAVRLDKKRLPAAADELVVVLPTPTGATVRLGVAIEWFAEALAAALDAVQASVRESDQ